MKAPQEIAVMANTWYSQMSGGKMDAHDSFKEVVHLAYDMWENENKHAPSESERESIRKEIEHLTGKLQTESKRLIRKILEG